MIGKKINQLATELAPVSTDLTIIGDPTTGVSKKITLAQLGAIFSGAVSFYTNLAAFPTPGSIDVIYCAKDTQKLYLWSGSAYVEVFPSQALLNTYQLRSEKGNANGYASLDSLGKVPISQLPSSIMEYKGTWNASTNTPTLANGTGDTGDVYICNVAGTVDFGAGGITFAVGDYVIYSGTIWQRSSGAVGTVTSVAATITGNSIGITGSPITTSGTLAFAFAGNATQYVRGDGQLSTLPAGGGGGGASVSYYLNGSINQGTISGVTYYEMNKTPIIGAGTDFSRSSNGYIASFLTDANDPALLNIPAGNWNFETYFEASSGGGSPTFYIELYKYDGTTFTLIASNSTSPKLINDGTNIEAYFSALAVPQTTLTLTDRLAVRIYVTTAGRTITLHTENSHLCQVITTFTTGLTALNGLTEQVQYFATGTSGTDFNIASATATHTFNLPTASATNRGALSSADWSTFNAKQNALNGTGFVKISGTTISYDNSTYYLASNPNAYIPLTALSAGAGISYNNTTGVIASTITQYTDALARAAISLTTTGTSGAATYNSTTGVLNVPQYAPDLSGYVPTSRTLTINGTAFDLSANRSWSVGTVTSVAALTIGTTGTDLSSTVANGTTTPVITLNVPTASATNRGALSSTDWTTFNNKQNALTNPVTGTGTTNTLPKFTGSSTLGNSILSESGGVLSQTNLNPEFRLVNTTATTGRTYKFNSFTDGNLYIGIPAVIDILTITASGNLGLGVTPSAWGTQNTVLQLLNNTSLISRSGFTALARNLFYTTSDVAAYISNGVATNYLQISGEHRWLNAVSGTAGATMTQTQAMTLDASGRLGIGTTSPGNYGARLVSFASSGKQFTATNGVDADFDILCSSGVTTFGADTGTTAIKSAGTTRLTIASTGAATFTQTGGSFLIDTNGHVISKQALDVATAGGRFTGQSNRGSLGAIHIEQTTTGADGGYIDFRTSNSGSTTPTSKMLISQAGNVGIGTTSPGEKLTVNGTIGLQNSGTQNWGIYTTSTNNIVFQRSGIADRMVITSDGLVGIGTTSPNATLHVNGTIRTSAPSGESSATWKLGNTRTATCVPGTWGEFSSWFTGTVANIEINGTTYTIPVVNAGYC
jgi:hypothetical protein